MGDIVGYGMNCVLFLFSLIVMGKHKSLVFSRDVKLPEFDFKESVSCVKNKPW